MAAAQSVAGSVNIRALGGVPVSGADVIDAPTSAIRVTGTTGTATGLALDVTLQRLLARPVASVRGPFQPASAADSSLVVALSPGTSLPSGTNVLGAVTGSGLFQITGSVTGTVTANIGAAGPIALDTSVNGLLQNQGSTTTGQKGPLVQGAVTLFWPVYTNGQTAPLSLTQWGALRVDASATTQPVSGQVTANAGTGIFTVGQGTPPWAVSAIQNGAWTVDQGRRGALGAPWYHAVTDGVRGPVAVTGPFQAVSPTDPALVVSLSPNSPLLPGLLLAQGSITGGQNGPLIQGAVTTGAPTYTAGQTSPLSLTTAGSLRFDLSGIGGTAQSGANVIDTANTAFRVNCVTGCTAAAAFTDNSAFTAGTTTETNIGGVFNDTLTGISSGNAAALRVTPYRAMHMNLRSQTGVELGTAASPLVVSAGPIQITSGATGSVAVKGPFLAPTLADVALVVSIAQPVPVTGVSVAQASTTGGQIGPIVQAAVTTATPSYTAGQTNPLSLTAAGALRTSSPSNSRTDTYTATASGVTVDVSASPLKSFAIQVVGTGGAATSWDVRLEGSLNNVNFSQILQHTTTTGDGAVLWSGATLSPSLYVRSRAAGLVLGGATNIVVTILGGQ